MILFVLFVFGLAVLYDLRNEVNLYRLLLLLYLGSFLSSFLLDVFVEEQSICFFPTFYLCIFLFICFSPFKKIGYQVVSDGIKEKKLAYILCLILFPATIFYLYYFILLLISGINLSQVRHVIYDDGSFIPQSFFNTFMAHFTPAYFLCIYLYFFSKANNWSKVLSFCLLFSSFSFPALTLANFGRDGIVYWLLNFVFLYSLFRYHLPYKTRFVIKKSIWIVSIVLLTVMCFITIMRFSDENMLQEVVESLLSYYGQQIQNFSDIFNVSSEKYSLFPGLRKILNLEVMSQDESYDLLLSLGLEDNFNVFSYFVSAFTKAFGKLGGLLIVLFFSMFVYSLKTAYTRTKSSYYFMLLFLFFQIPMNGVFYYRQGIGNMDVSYLFICLILFVLFRIKFKNILV